MENQPHGWMETRADGETYEARTGRTQPRHSTPTPFPPLYSILDMNAVTVWLAREERTS